MSLIKKHIGIFFIILFAVLASLPLFHSGFYPMHDDEQIARLFDLHRALSLGQFPPRIAPNLGFGYGYPFFNFYPSFAYYVAEIFHLLGFGFILSTKLMLFTGFLLAAFFSYLLGKSLFGKWGGIVVAAFYTFAPYHAVDIYVRGAYAEFFSFVFIPPIFWFLYKLSKSLNTLYIVPLSLSVAFLILSHNLIFIMGVPFILAWFLYLIYSSDEKKKLAAYSLLGLILGFGVSAYFSLPSFLEKDFTLVRILTSELADYNLHFVCIHQLWSSTWGYGGSIPSCFDGLSFEVGKIQIIVSALVLILFFYFSFFKKREGKSFLLVPLFFALLSISMFLTVRQSKLIWDALPLLSYIQFPWRFLTYSIFFSSLLAGSIFIFFKDKKVKLLLAAVMVLSVIGFTISDFNPREYTNVSDADYVSQEKIRWDTSSLAYEYVPGSIATKKSKDNTTLVDISKNEIKNEPFKVIKGIMVAKVLSDLPQSKKFDVYALTNGVLRINTYSFPGWAVYIDGKKTQYTHNNKLVLIDVKVPFGKHTVKAVFEDTAIRKLGNLVSVISIIGICWVGITAIKQKKVRS